MKTNILITTIGLAAVLIIAAFYFLPHTIGVPQCGDYGGYRQYRNGPCSRNTNYDWNQDTCEGNCLNSEWNNPDEECCQPQKRCYYSDNEFQKYDDVPNTPQGYGCPWMYN